MTSEGIYRKSGVTSRVTALLEQFRSDARSQCLREGENQVDDVSSTLKRFFRELEEGLFTPEDTGSWLSTTGMFLLSGCKKTVKLLKRYTYRCIDGYRYCACLCLSAIQDKSQKVSSYKLLLGRLPPVNKATLQALINHLYW